MKHYRASLRFPRTLDEAFKGHRYGAALEIPYPSFWRRLLIAIKESFCG